MPQRGEQKGDKDRSPSSVTSVSSVVKKTPPKTTPRQADLGLKPELRHTRTKGDFTPHPRALSPSTVEGGHCFFRYSKNPPVTRN
ncbi:hypothetical protein LBMAG46_33160 [Planctomycetia bacterium]|nr:hypothetical protein LBMAG46_33160 [Planctomycetia bacterium]